MSVIVIVILFENQIDICSVKIIFIIFKCPVLHQFLNRICGNQVFFRGVKVCQQLYYLSVEFLNIAADKMIY